MRTLALTSILLASSLRLAHAGGDVGVVVTADQTTQPQVLAQVEGWLRGHGHQLVASPLPPESITKVIDCFVVEDQACARKVVEAESKTTTFVFARIDVEDNAGGMRDVTMTAYWFERGAGVVAERRTCEKCTDARLRTTADELMSALAGASRKTVGQLQVTSSPKGASVTVDGHACGTTPLELALAPGEHQVEIAAEHHRSMIRPVTITQGQPSPLDAHLESLLPRRSKVPYALIGGGGALLLTGIILYATSETDTGETYQYRDTRALGATLSVAGLAVAGVGGYLWWKAGKATDSAPAVVVLPGSAYVGWAGAF